jgi:hypothetical protein
MFVYCINKPNRTKLTHTTDTALPNNQNIEKYFNKAYILCYVTFFSENRWRSVSASCELSIQTKTTFNNECCCTPATVEIRSVVSETHTASLLCVHSINFLAKNSYKVAVLFFRCVNVGYQLHSKESTTKKMENNTINTYIRISAQSGHCSTGLQWKP